ncbi:MAG: hypothetical protein JWR49_27, partial [Tardiphaga sp.]|nr:hypothetical protein [Tardiphaga sp.]
LKDCYSHTREGRCFSFAVQGFPSPLTYLISAS